MAFRIHKGIFQSKNASNVYENKFKIDDESGALIAVDAQGAQTGSFLKTTDVATDSNLLDGLDSTAFLRTSGGTLTGQLNMHASSYEGSIVFGSASTWRTGIRQHDDADAELRIWAKNASGMIFLATGYDGEPADIARPTDGLAIQGNKLGIGDFSAADPSYKLHVKGDIYANGGWVRVSGTKGLYFESYGGGWNMSDSTWIRAYNNKSIYTGGNIEATGSVRADSGVHDANTRFVIPGGASSVGNPSGTGGAIKIELPVAAYGINTMMSMTVQVYEYSTGQSFTIRCGGYNYYSHDWYNVFAYLLNDSGKGSNVPVYFGNDGTRDVIWIGNSDWSWSYPNVFVTDFQAGHTTSGAWRTGWRVIFDTAARTNVTASRTAHRQIDTGNIGSQSVNYATTAGTANAVAWGNITSVPSSFTPSAHNHDDRYYTESEVDTLLDGKQDSGSYAASSHSHAISDVTGLQTALDNKQASGSYAAASHNQGAATITSGTFQAGRYSFPYQSGTTGSAAPSYTNSNVEIYTDSNHVPTIGFHRGGVSATALYEYDGQLYVKPWVTRAQVGLLLSSGNIGSYAWTSGNDGAASGLDADLLDGLHASSFLRSDNGVVRISTVTSGVSLSVGNGTTHGVYTSDDNRKGVVFGADYYPHVFIVASGSNNTNHGGVLSFVGTEGSSPRQWNMGTSNQNPFLFSIGYNSNADTNPHYGLGDNWNSNDANHARLLIDRSGNVKIRGSLYVNGTKGAIDTGSKVATESWVSSNYQAAGSYAAASHSHAISDVTGLQTALDGKQASGSYASSSSVININTRYNGAIAADGWYTIATYGSGRALATFHLYDTDSSRHNYVEAKITWSYGNGGVHIVNSGRHGVSTIKHIRLLYDTLNQTYGGVKVQVYCENASWTLKIRQEYPNDIDGWGSFSQVTPVLENSIDSWAEYSRAYNVNDQGVISTSSNAGWLAGNAIATQPWVSANYQAAGSYAAASHTHDDRYYTETEVNTLLAGKLSTTGKAADAETVDGIDSSRIVYGDGANGRSVSRTDGNANTSDSSNASGFYFGTRVAGMPTTDWWNWVTVRGNSWSGSDGYHFQLAGSFWSDDFRIRRMQSGSNKAWVTLMHSGNISSQSVNYASSAGAVAWGNITSVPSSFTPSSHTHNYILTQGNYVWNADTRAGDYTTGIQTSFVRGADGFPDYGAVLHVGARGGNDAGGDFQIYCGHGSANGGNYLRVRNADNNANPSDSWTDWRVIWDSGNFDPDSKAAASHTHDDRYYTESEVDTLLAAKLSTTGKAANSELLDGLDSSAYLRDDGWNSSPGQDATTQRVMSSDFTYSNNAPHTGELLRFGAGGYSLQLNASYQNSDNLSFRTYNNDSAQAWNPWRTIIHSGNIGSQSVNYAGSAGSLTSMNISQFTNNSGYITSNNATGSNGNFYIDDNYGYGIVGAYSPTRYQGIWAMGDAYKLPGDGRTPGTLYGLAWTYNPDYSGAGNNAQAKTGLNHQLLLMMNGRTYTALGAGIWTDGTITTTSHGTSANWNTAYGWGNHASAGYLTALPAHTHDDRYYTESEVDTLLDGKQDSGSYAASSHTHAISDVTGLQTALDNKQASGSYAASSHNHDGTYQKQVDEQVVDLRSPNASSGTWNTGGGGDWGTPRIGASPARYADGSAYLQFNVPSGMDTAYISQLTWSSGGYADIYGIQADGGAVFLRRINTKQNIENSGEGSGGGNPNQHDGSAVTLIGTGLSTFSAVRIQNRAGRIHLTGMSFTSNRLVGTEGTGLIHPAQLCTTIGLDADTLDGLHASSFLQSLPAHTHDDRYYTESEVDTLLAGKQATGTYLTSLPSHDHSSITGSAAEVSIRGYGSNSFSFQQTSGSFAGYTGWANHFIGNHGNGSTYYNTVHIMPFWDVPRYSRLEGGEFNGVYQYWTEENFTPSAKADKAGSSSVTFSASDMNVHAWTRIHGGNGIYFQTYGYGLRSPNGEGVTYGNIATYGTGRNGWSGYSVGNWISLMAVESRRGLFLTDTDRWLIKYDGGDAFSDYEIQMGSDARNKSNVQNLTGSLDKVKALRGVSYNYKNQERTSLGFIAQEVKQVIPEVVSADSEGYYAIGYQSLIAVLSEAIKEQQTIIDALTARVEALENNR